MSRRLQIALGALFAIPGVWQLCLLGYAVISRFAFPYDLEWMEGGLLDHAARIQEGSGLYAAPSVEFIPYLYTPLYPGLLALLGEPLGLGYGLGRAIGVMALAVVLAAIAVAGLRRDSETNLEAAIGGALGCGLAASAYPWVEGWYDIVRGDMLFVAMAIGGLAALARPALSTAPPSRRDHGRVAFAAALLALSFFCKQHGIWFVGAGGLALLVFRRWRLIPIYVGVAGVIGLGFSWLLQRSTGGWFWTYVYEVLRGHDFNMPRFRSAFPTMLGRAPVATALCGVTAVLVAVRRLRGEGPGPAARRFLFWLPAYAVALLAGAFGWGHQWAHFNAYVPFIFVDAVLVATALPAIAEGLAPRWSRFASLAAAAALGAQLLALTWSPAPWIPRDADRQAGDKLIARLAAIDGDILVPSHPWYAHLAGKQTRVHRMGLMDMQYQRRYRVAGLQEAFAQRRFAAVVLDRAPQWFPGLRGPYRPDEILPRDQRPRTVTGARTAPTYIWRPADTPIPAGARVLFDFESGRLEGWTVEGTAWGRRPVSRKLPTQGEVYGARGRYWVTSFHGRDRAVGTLTSPPFVIDGSRITARIGGGRRGVRAELRIGDRVVGRATGQDNEALVPVEWNVEAHRGKRATIVLVDEATGSWGHLSADEFWLWK